MMPTALHGHAPDRTPGADGADAKERRKKQQCELNAAGGVNLAN
jgi:hypothetical protein